MNKEKLLVIVGPTAVGKTELSLVLARKLHGEIISGDSMQVYRGMDIGTAKISEEERREIPHYMIDIKDPDEEFSVAEFQERSIKLITEINERGKLPMIVGGTGLYIESVTHRFHFSNAYQDQEFRKKMSLVPKEELHRQLQEIDPKTAERLHPNDVKRVIRALEIYHLSGQKMSSFQEREKESPYRLCMIGLTMDREKLYERINRRVDLMIKQGLIEEVKRLLHKGYSPELVSMQGLGYKELVPYINNEIPLHEAVERIKKRTRHFAKRQLTWFRRMKEIAWFDVTEIVNKEAFYQKIVDYAAGKLR